MCRECNTERAKKYRSTEKGRRNINKAVKKSIEKHSDKQKARIVLNYHVRMGYIIKPKGCQKCKKKLRLEGHHDDYEKALEVLWVCKTCHIEVDKELRTKKK